jgi:hypothetical protein
MADTELRRDQAAQTHRPARADLRYWPRAQRRSRCSPAPISRRYSQGLKVEPRIAATLAALVRLVMTPATMDALRRAA